MNPAWYFGKIARKEAEKIVMAHERSVFLVRESSQAGQFAVTLWLFPKKSLVHLLVSQVNTQYQLDGCKDTSLYNDVPELVAKSPMLKPFVPVGNA